MDFIELLSSNTEVLCSDLSCPLPQLRTSITQLTYKNQSLRRMISFILDSFVVIYFIRHPFQAIKSKCTRINGLCYLLKCQIIFADFTNNFLFIGIVFQVYLLEDIYDYSFSVLDVWRRSQLMSL